MVATREGLPGHGRDLRRAAEFARHNHQRLIEPARGVQILDERGNAVIERGQEHVLQPAEVVDVRVPMLHRPHIDLHDRHAGFDEGSIPQMG
jgi:hypothetical protein